MDRQVDKNLEDYRQETLGASIIFALIFILFFVIFISVSSKVDKETKSKISETLNSEVLVGLRS